MRIPIRTEVEEFSNPYHGIEYAPAVNKFKVVVGSHPQRLVGVYDTLEEAIKVRNIECAKELRAPRETATNPKKHYEMRTVNA